MGGGKVDFRKGLGAVGCSIARVLGLVQRERTRSFHFLKKDVCSNQNGRSMRYF